MPNGAHSKLNTADTSRDRLLEKQLKANQIRPLIINGFSNIREDAIPTAHHY